MNVHLKKPYIIAVPLVVALIILSGCATTQLDPWSQFMYTVIESAQDDNYDRLVQELSLYRHFFLLILRQQAG